MEKKVMKSALQCITLTAFFIMPEPIQRVSLPNDIAVSSLHWFSLLLSYRQTSLMVFFACLTVSYAIKMTRSEEHSGIAAISN